MVMGTVRKNVKTPLKALNEEVLVTTYAFLRTVPVLVVKCMVWRIGWVLKVQPGKTFDI
jgi:hypothetical protein